MPYLLPHPLLNSFS